MTHISFVLLLLFTILNVDSKATSSSSSSSSSSSEEKKEELEGLKIGNASETDTIIHDQAMDKDKKLEIINVTIFDEFDNDTARELALEKYEKAIQLDGFAQEYVENDEKIKNITEQIENLVSTDNFKKMSEDDQKEELDKFAANLTDDDIERIEEFENVIQTHIRTMGFQKFWGVTFFS